METREKKRKEQKEFGAEISSALEKLVKERLGHLEHTVLLGNKLYTKPTLEEVELYLGDKAAPQIQAEITLEKSDIEIGENVQLEIELQNVGKAPVRLTRVEEIVPNGFELVVRPDDCDVVNTYVDMHGKKLDPYASEYLRLTLRATKKGSFTLSPRVLFMWETGRRISIRSEPASINVAETILPNRVSTGFKDLDNLLFGGIPQNYAVILTSVSCDERELLIKRYLGAGLEDNNDTVYITIDASSVRSLVEEFQTSFFVFVCSPKLDETLEKLPNVFKLGGVENLTEININLESILRRLGESKGFPRRACLEILSDVLLQYHAVQTRKWLSGLVSELRSKGFTTLAVMNPRMHAPEETHAVLDLFEGEINIYEKEAQKDLIKYLRIKKMYNHRYLESELPLRKTRMMTTPLKLPCCTRTPHL